MPEAVKVALTPVSLCQWVAVSGIPKMGVCAYGVHCDAFKFCEDYVFFLTVYLCSGSLFSLRMVDIFKENILMPENSVSGLLSMSHVLGQQSLTE